MPLPTIRMEWRLMVPRVALMSMWGTGANLEGQRRVLAPFVLGDIISVCMTLISSKGILT